MIRRWTKRILGGLGIVLFLAIAFLLFLHTSWGRNIVRNKAENYLSQTLHTTINIQELDYNLLHWVQIKNFTVSDQHKDTLFWCGKLYVNVNLFKLLFNHVVSGSVELQGARIYVNKTQGDSTFNYAFLTKAFTGNSKRDSTDPGSNASIQFDIRSILLSDIFFSMHDYASQEHYSARFRNFECVPGKLDLQKLLFNIKELQISGAYLNAVDSSFAVESKIGQLKTAGVSISLAQQKLHCLQVALDNSGFSLSVSARRKPSTERKSISSNTAKPGWVFAIDGIDLKNNAVSYHNQAMKPVQGFDPNHIDAHAINFVAEQVVYDSTGFSSKIDDISFMVNDRFQLKSFSTEIKYTNGHFQSKDLALVYNNSMIRLNGTIQATGQQRPGTYSACKVDIVVNYKDVLELYPQIKTSLPVSMPPHDKITLKGVLTGSLEDLSMDHIQLNSDLYHFSGAARFQNSNKKRGPVYYITINELVVRKNLLSPSLLKQLKQQNISLPESLAISGTVHGNINSFFSDVHINSAYGQLAIKGIAENFNHPERMQYDVRLYARHLETGRWINNEKVLGKLDADITLKGMGTNPASLQATSDVQVGSISLNGYRYTNVILNASINKGRFSATANISDPNLSTALQLTGSIVGNYPILSGNVSIEKADLKSLGLSPDPMSVSGSIKIDTFNAGPAHLLASITTTNTVLATREKTVNIDTLSIRAHSENNGTELSVNGPFVYGSFTSNFPVDQLPRQLREAFKQLSQNKVYSGDSNGWFKVSAIISHDSLLSVFVPELELKQPLRINGMLDSRGTDSSFYLDVAAPAIRYGNIAADSLNIRSFNSGAGKIFSVTAGSFTSGTDSFYVTRLDGTWKDSTLEFTSSIQDKKQVEMYAFKSSVDFHKDEIIVSLPTDFVLNHNTWKVPSNNKVKIRNNGIIAQNLTLSKGRHTISINTLSADSVSPVQIKTDSIDLGALAALATLSDTSAISGKLNIDVVIQQPISSFPIFTGKAGLYQLAFHEQSIGDFEIQSMNSSDSLQLAGKLTGPNEMRVAGSIHPKEKELRMDVNVEKLDLSMLQMFLEKYIPRAYGFIKADLHVAGKMDRPQLNGVIRFDSTGFAIAELNTVYRINNQQIVIDYPTVKFNEFALSDSAGNKLTVDGTVKTAVPGKYELDLQAKTRDFVALNSKQLPESSLYGKAIINVDVGIKGTGDHLAINGNIFLREGSDIHYVVPGNKTYIKGNERIRFVDIDTVPLPGAELLVLKDSLKIPKPLQKMMYNMKLDISKDASLSILIDPATRDELLIRGEAQLNTGIEEDGSVGITGVYKLQSGYYNMNTQFLKGKFMLKNGSTISFNGNPYDAIADITTEYEVKTSPSGLLKSSRSDQAGASEKIPFLIVFKVKGPVSKPELSFDIRQKEKMSGASNSLQTSIDNELAKLRNDQTAMNKQVFSLLVMNQFTVYTNESNMAESNLNPDVMLRQGMSQFISDAMNSVADGLVKGVDVNVNFQNYKDDSKSSGTRTDVGVSLSKNMNDRLTVTVGKNFTSGTNSQSYAKQADQYIPDITTTYRLSKDGRYYLKAYRKNEYDVVVEGYFAKTGVSFTIQMDFNKFKDLFTRAGKLQNP